MSRVRTDPLVAALTHPTRQGAYQALSQTTEMSTVQLQAALNVDRYNLYHHLRKLESLGLVMNHRDQGRTRWWCVIDRVPLPSDGSIESSDNSLGSIDLSNPRVQAAARTMLRELATLSGSDINIDSATLENLEIIGRRN